MTSVFAEDIRVEITTDQNVTLDLLFLPEPQVLSLQPGTQTFNFEIVQPQVPDLNFLQSDHLVDWNSKEVQKTFAHLQGTDKEIIVQAIQYIQENVEYDLTSIAAEGSQKVSWVLQNNKGVCDEITATLIAAARLHQIPARFVHGYAYTTSELFDEPWQPHTWAEVYIDEQWTPIDITFNQYTQVYEDHIPFIISNRMDQNQYSISYHGDEPNINVQYTIPFTPNTTKQKVDYTVSVPEQVNYESHIPITITAEDDSIKSVFIFAPDTFEVINPKVMTKKMVAWVLPPELEQQYVYTIPISILVNEYTINHSTIIDSTPINFQYKQTREGNQYWCEYVAELTCYSDSNIEMCKGECYSVGPSGTVIPTQSTEGVNTVQLSIDGETQAITYYVPEQTDITCNISSNIPTTIEISPTNTHENVTITVSSPFHLQTINYDTLQQSVEHTIEFQTYFDGMEITAHVRSNEMETVCTQKVSIKVEGWDLIPNFFYKILSKIISYA